MNNIKYTVVVYTHQNGMILISPVVSYNQNGNIFECVTESGEQHYLSMNDASHIHIKPQEIK